MAAQQWRDYKFSLQAGVPRTIGVTGDYWQIITASAEITLKFDEGDTITRTQGTGGPADYSRVTITSGVDQPAVVLALGKVGSKPPYDARATFAGTVNVSTDLPTVIEPLEDVDIAAASNAMLADADSTRTALVVRMPESAAGDVRIGDSSVAANKGLRLGPGDAASIPGGAAVYAYNTAGASVAVSLIAERAP